jgi:hypothetical protein
MLLRRVIAHFRKQEWTAIGIDFVIVVVGVFIGIQVANWNEARNDRLRGRAYLERIHADLEADIQNYERKLEFWRGVSVYGAICLDYSDGRRTAGTSVWPVLLACFQASQLDDFRTTDATYQELRSAGELNLIEDRPLRGTLADYYVKADNPSLSERPAYREHVRGIIPLDVQLYIWRSCFRTTSGGEQTLLDCTSPVSEVRASEILNAVCGDETLMRELRYWMSTMEVASSIGRDRITYARQLVARIESDLQR